jgi:hypothetical protein
MGGSMKPFSFAAEWRKMVLMQLAVNHHQAGKRKLSWYYLLLALE